VILLQLLVEKLLWWLRNPLKDKHTDGQAGSGLEQATQSKRSSLKRQLRTMYRYASYFLMRAGTILPKEGTPLKLLVVAEKRDEVSPS
jgi:hypothetical protein